MFLYGKCEYAIRVREFVQGVYLRLLGNGTEPFRVHFCKVDFGLCVF